MLNRRCTLESELARLVATLGQMPQIVKAVPEFDKLSQQLLPKADGDQLSLDLTEENGGIDALTSVAGPTLRALSASLDRRKLWPALFHGPSARTRQAGQAGKAR